MEKHPDIMLAPHPERPSVPCAQPTPQPKRPYAAARKRVIGQLRAAEAAGTCYAPHDPGDRRAARRMAASGNLIDLGYGVYAQRGAWEALPFEKQMRYLLRGLAAAHPTWSFFGPSAALAWGLDVPHALLQTVHVISNRAPRIPPAAARPVRARRPSPRDRIVSADRLPVTDFRSTVFECLARAPFSLGLAVADSALRRMDGDRGRFLTGLEQVAHHRHGCRRALFTASHAIAEAESGGESRLRAFLLERGYMLPRFQVELPNVIEQGHVFRADFLWNLAGDRYVIGEFDGKVKYQDERMLQGAGAVGALLKERQRESRLTLLGYPVLRFTYHDLVHPARLSHLLDTAGIPRSQEAAQAFQEAWRATAPGAGTR